MDKFLDGLSNVIKIVFAVIKTIVAFAILIWLVDKIFGLKLNLIKIDFINKISAKELTTVVVLLLIWMGFKNTDK